MLTRRRVSRALYFSVILLGLFLLLTNLFAGQHANNVVEFSPTIDAKMAKLLVNSGFNFATQLDAKAVVVAAPVVISPKVTQKSIVLSKLPSIASVPEAPSHELLVDTGLVRLYNKIAVRKIQSIFDRTMEQENNAFSEPATVNNSNKLALCSEFPHLLGFHNVDLNGTMENTTESDIELEHPDVQAGHWSPSSCTPRHKVAIIVPFRDREKHLVVMLKYLIPIWKRQQIYFKVFVVEQFGDEAFNKGRVMNAGFLEALKQDDFHCFVFHDVDLVPINDYNMYTCPQNPRHMSVMVDELDNQYPYDELAGGVFSIRTEHFQLVNGYNNLFWGWGAEDDDMGFRVQRAGLRLERPSSAIAQYRMIRHTKRKTINQKRKVIILHNKKQRSHMNGVNSVTYTVASIVKKLLYQHVVVDVGRFDNNTLI